MISGLQKILAIQVIAIVVSACGGGGGGGGGTVVPPPPPPVQEFSMSALKSANSGTVYVAQLSGSDSLGGQWTGSLSITNRSQTMVDGVLATPQETLFSIIISGVEISAGAITYIDGSGYTLNTVLEDGSICTPAFLYQLPDNIKVGDSGMPPTETCTNNVVIESSWIAEGAGNGNINYVVTRSISADKEIVEFWTLNVAGNFLAYRRVETGVGPDRATLTLTSN